MAILGSQIEDMAERMGVELIDNNKLIQEMDEDTDTILEDDGYHITKTAGAIIANEIKDSIEQRENNTRKGNRQPRDTNTPRTGKTESGEMYIDANMTSHRHTDKDGRQQRQNKNNPNNNRNKNRIH